MSRERSRYGLLASALGAIVLAISVFLPWYGVSLTPGGIALVQQVGDHLAAEYGNATLQAEVGGLHGEMAGFAGQQVVALSAHQALKYMNIVLLVLAGLALLDALVPLARSDSSLPDGAGASVVLVGSVASVCVIFRMIVPPTPPGGVLALSLREGAWLALLGSLTMVLAGLWPLVARGGGAARPDADSSAQGIWTNLSGWTPEG